MWAVLFKREEPRRADAIEEFVLCRTEGGEVSLCAPM